MKKIIAVVLSLILALSLLAGCQGGSDEKDHHRRRFPHAPRMDPEGRR